MVFTKFKVFLQNRENMYRAAAICKLSEPTTPWKPYLVACALRFARGEIKRIGKVFAWFVDPRASLFLPITLRIRTRSAIRAGNAKFRLIRPLLNTIIIFCGIFRVNYFTMPSKTCTKSVRLSRRYWVRPTPDQRMIRGRKQTHTHRRRNNKTTERNGMISNLSS
jgi:hypothetical protein